ncbi:alpha/beta fold hydrolase [Amycolatopsis methanolica]|uniref:Alpha/beta hydrolase fold protein n=1 Tax=Amycolatopsis methanolica 239 TaxID=1068978 RepID=A0A076MW66_AMYME|nr:alpha/beta hydrolase [Amycolatopsis methanolica]AIJ23316.1 alpha/beta hydrolase fold protein [Amycolatopsis methanolica 239]
MAVAHDRLTFARRDVTLAADRWAPDRPLGTVLLLHGGGQTRHSWQRTGRRLAGHGWTAIALDARGHGDSDWPADADYGMDAMVADLREVAARLDDPPVLVGASMGGMTALLAQGEDPGLGRALVLVDVTPRIEPAGTAEVAAFMRSGLDGFDSLEDAAAAVMAYNPNRRRPPRPDGLRKNLRERDGRWYWHWDPRFLHTPGDAEQAAQTRRARAAAASLTVPTLLVRGGDSRIVSPAGARELLDLVPHAEIVDVRGAGHMVAGDDNDVFAQRLLGFLGDRVTPLS